MSRGATSADVLSGAARWCVVEGDNAPLLASLADGAVGVTLTDPPYNERTHRGARVKGAGLQTSSVVTFESLRGCEWWPDVLRITRRWCIAFCAQEQLGLYEAAAPGEWIRAGLWVKPSAPPQFTGDRPGTGAEGIAIAHRKGRKRWNGGGRVALWSCGFTRAEVGDDRVHPTQKPLALMRELVSLFSEPDEIVFDLYAGSGTTGVAALAEGRRVILCERSPEFAEIARRRCHATETGAGWRVDAQASLFGGAA